MFLQARVKEFPQEEATEIPVCPSGWRQEPYFCNYIYGQTRETKFLPSIFQSFLSLRPFISHLLDEY